MKKHRDSYWRDVTTMIGKVNSTYIIMWGVVMMTASCGSEEDIRVYDAPVDPPHQLQQAALQQRAPLGPEGIQWKLPSGWKQQSGQSGMRYATLESQSDLGGYGHLEVTVTRLAHSGGGLLANVNRWRRQLGMTQIRESQLADHVAQLESPSESGLLVEIAGQAPDSLHLIAAVFFRPHAAWFFKAIAGQAVVVQHKQAFTELARSVRFVLSPRDQGAEEVFPSEDISWHMPEGWEQEAVTNSLVRAAFKVGQGNQTAQVAVTGFPGDVGGMVPNINRWRQQLGLDPISDIQQQVVETVSVDNQEGRLIELTGPNTSAGHMIVVMVQHENLTWFFKMTGNETLVKQHRPSFLAFVGSVRFSEASRE